MEAHSKHEKNSNRNIKKTQAVEVAEVQDDETQAVYCYENFGC